MPENKFTEVSKIVVLSTGHVTVGDSALMSWQDCPCHLADHDHGHGDIFYVPVDFNNESGHDVEMQEYGLSTYFIEIFREACRRGIGYLRFDSDGPTEDWLPTFDW